MLARWAVAALDTTTQSLTYIKPKLATRIKQLERQAARWLQQHAAYLPLLSDPTVQLARNASDGEWSGIPGDDLTRVWVPTTAGGPNRALTAAQRRLAWATANIERLAAGSPAVLLDYDVLRRVARKVRRLLDGMELCWTNAHPAVTIAEDGARATRERSGWRSALCGEVLRAEGEAYAEFTYVGGHALVGVARAGVDPSSLSGGLYNTAGGWMYACGGADLYRGGGGGYYHRGSQTPWASGEEQGIKEGDVVGLLLRQGSLSVFVKGKRVGTMVTGLTGELA